MAIFGGKRMIGKKIRTNGDMIKALFPQLKAERETALDDRNYIFLTKDYNIIGAYEEKWWDEPYTETMKGFQITIKN